MMGGVPIEIVAVILTVAFGGVGWLLNSRDAAQQRQINELRDLAAEKQKLIDMLFDKNDALELSLTNLRLHIARSHYEKTELDGKFDKLETLFRSGMADISMKMDRLLRNAS
jgi:uncharacterized coiled-coil protein SlyX